MKLFKKILAVCMVLFIAQFTFVFGQTRIINPDAENKDNLIKSDVVESRDSNSDVSTEPQLQYLNV